MIDIINNTLAVLKEIENPVVFYVGFGLLIVTATTFLWILKEKSKSIFDYETFVVPADEFHLVICPLLDGGEMRERIFYAGQEYPVWEEDRRRPEFSQKRLPSHLLEEVSRHKFGGLKGTASARQEYQALAA